MRPLDSGTVPGGVLHFQVSRRYALDTTERPETIECGSNILSGATWTPSCAAVATAVRDRAELEPHRNYWRRSVADTVSRILVGHSQGRRMSRAHQRLEAGRLTRGRRSRDQGVASTTSGSGVFGPLTANTGEN